MKKSTYLCCLALLCVFLPVQAQQASNNKPVLIYGEIESNHPVDTIRVEFWDNYLDKYITEPPPLIRYCPVRAGSLFEGAPRMQVFHCTIPSVSSPGYIRISDGNGYYLDMYLAQPGDSIKIRFDKVAGQTIFAGAAANKFRCQYEMDLARATGTFSKKLTLTTDSKAQLLNDGENRQKYELGKEQLGRGLRIIERGEEQFERLQSRFNTGIDKRFGILQTYEDVLSNETYEILRANLIGEIRAGQITSFYKYLYSFAKGRADNTFLSELNAFYTSHIKNMPTNDFNEDIVRNSIGYLDFLLEKAFAQRMVEGSDVYEILKDNYTGIVRDKLLSKYMLRFFEKIPERDVLLKDALQIVETPHLHRALEVLALRQGEGRTALNFSLPDVNGDLVELSDFKGRTVLIDFWYTGCKACIYFYRDHLSKVEAEFKENDDFVLISISTDKEKEKWLKSIRGGKYTSETAVNLYTGGAGYDHNIIRYYNIKGYPHQLLIDRYGKIFRSGGLHTNADKLITIIEKAMSLKP